MCIWIKAHTTITNESHFFVQSNAQWTLTLCLLNFLNGIIHHPFSELSIIIFLVISRWELKFGQFRIAGWSGSILVVKANHFRFQQDKSHNKNVRCLQQSVWKYWNLKWTYCDLLWNPRKYMLVFFFIIKLLIKNVIVKLDIQLYKQWCKVTPPKMQKGWIFIHVFVYFEVYQYNKALFLFRKNKTCHRCIALSIWN